MRSLTIPQMTNDTNGLTTLENPNAFPVEVPSPGFEERSPSAKDSQQNADSGANDERQSLAAKGPPPEGLFVKGMGINL